MNVILPNGDTQELAMGPLTVVELLQHLGISLGEVLVSKNKCIIPEDSILENGDNVRIMQVVFGG
ncbi:MAG: sulfur carrier protein [Methanolobus sp.]|jgi:sulfur carrier protein ThiS|uniref:MoaD/ThiS family protein n=1 Tax=unclassified Methanolobus TaxID=2629569 RepID=UPI0024AB0DCA|nr:sulfur carrier protein [Methanolobus sp.]MDK2939433.1 sulfur carrier protein [Methanolobus sp.]